MLATPGVLNRVFYSPDPLDHSIDPLDHSIDPLDHSIDPLDQPNENRTLKATARDFRLRCVA
jgi:hypothetical protein